MLIVQKEARAGSGFSFDQDASRQCAADLNDPSIGRAFSGTNLSIAPEGQRQKEQNQQG